MHCYGWNDIASSQSPLDVEFEAAKFLQQLIQNSTDEPIKLATKLYAIVQYMKSMGKENSMPYQVISRAMETVIGQHNIDIDGLKRVPNSHSTGGNQTGASAEAQYTGAGSQHSRAGQMENDASEIEEFSASHLSACPINAECGSFQGPVTYRSTLSSDLGSPSLDTRSANSQSQERVLNQKVKQATKRKRGDSTIPSKLTTYNSHKVDAKKAVSIPKKGKMSKDDFPGPFSRANGGMPESSSSYPDGESGLSGSFALNASDPQIVLNKPSVHAHTFAPNHMENLSASISTGKVLKNETDNEGRFADPSKIIQGGLPIGSSDVTWIRAASMRNIGRPPFSQSPFVSVMPFKEQQLNQLKAQCLVLLSLRSGMMPTKLHLEVALGNLVSQDRLAGASQLEPSPERSSLCNLEAVEDKNSPLDLLVHEDERKHFVPARKAEAETHHIHETAELQEFPSFPCRQPNSGRIRMDAPFNNPSCYMENGDLQMIKPDHVSLDENMNEQVNPDSFNKIDIDGDTTLGESKPDNLVAYNRVFEKEDGTLSDEKLPELLEKHDINFFDDGMKDSICTATDQVVEDKLACSDLPSLKLTMSDKWILDYKRNKLLAEQNWLLKEEKAKNKIATCFEKIKESVVSSDDICARTRSIIGLKKLQLLHRQRRLRSDFLNDFFKPITADVDNLKSFKKHKHGSRRIRQLEKFEQKMKEERQKRIRERQKEFFSEIELHKERMEEVCKIKRERWKSFNKFVKEFHKRKERFHREKTDRIQREKINLLKINDVEGYLRMVKDAKSDRVKQLLKETETYLQKLGAKLQDAKALTRHSGSDVDQTAAMNDAEKYEFAIDNEDDSDQAKHFMESNEKYYMMAHSVKETISEQPRCLQRGKLREYQMNGLRWLVSLHCNHLNGILADEMGLGKTVQVISLICYLMETKNDRGPFLVVVPSSVLPGWESEINFWAPGIHKIIYCGPPEERRKLFREKIVHQKFNVLLTTYEYLMNKHDRPKLSKLHWHYIIIDEGHRIKNASCKLNADLKHYQSSHRLLLTGTPLQNNLEELWALLNFLLPNIFNSSEDFSQWFNKPFESNADNSADEALLSEEENLLIINRLHQVLRPFVLRRLKHKVENELPEKIERLIRCEASAYQKLLMKRVEENLGSIGNSKVRSVHNSVMELRNICNHPYISQLHAEEIESMLPRHFLAPIVRVCGKLEMLDRLLPKLKATDHRVLFFSTMTRLLDVMEEYLSLKQYRYLRLDGHTSGTDRGTLIDLFNHPDSCYFIFLLSIRAGGVGVNLQAADTVIIFDTDWNPQVDLQAQARAHRIGQKRDVLVLRFETVQTVEEQVRAAAEHKLGVANQSITAGFFDNNTSAEDRREYLESLLRESKKEEVTPVLDDDALNDMLARSQSEIDIFESVDKQRQEEEMETWKKLLLEQGISATQLLPPLPPPPRLVTDDELQLFCEKMMLYDITKGDVVSNINNVKRKGEHLGNLDTQQYGRGKRAREVRSYEEQWTEEEFEKMCQVDSPESHEQNDEKSRILSIYPPSTQQTACAETTQLPPSRFVEPPSVAQHVKEAAQPSKRGRGRPRKVTSEMSLQATLPLEEEPCKIGRVNAAGLEKGIVSFPPGFQNFCSSRAAAAAASAAVPVCFSSNSMSPSVSATPYSQPMKAKGHSSKGVQVLRRGKNAEMNPIVSTSLVLRPLCNAACASPYYGARVVQASPAVLPSLSPPCPAVSVGQTGKCEEKDQGSNSTIATYVLAGSVSQSNLLTRNSVDTAASKPITLASVQEKNGQEMKGDTQEQAFRLCLVDKKAVQENHMTQPSNSSVIHQTAGSIGSYSIGHGKSGDMISVASGTMEVSPEKCVSEVKLNEGRGDESAISSNMCVLSRAPAEVFSTQISHASSSRPVPCYSSNLSASQSAVTESVRVTRQGRKSLNHAHGLTRRPKKQGIFSPSSGRNVATSLTCKQEKNAMELMNPVQGQDHNSNEAAASQFHGSNVTDVARVMKEIFSETCSPKTRAAAPSFTASPNEDGNAPATTCMPKREARGNASSKDTTHPLIPCMDSGIGDHLSEEESLQQENQIAAEPVKKGSKSPIGMADRPIEYQDQLQPQSDSAEQEATEQGCSNASYKLIGISMETRDQMPASQEPATQNVSSLCEAQIDSLQVLSAQKVTQMGTGGHVNLDLCLAPEEAAGFPVIKPSSVGKE